jgi:WW domain
MAYKRKTPPTEDHEAPPLPDEPLPSIDEQPPLPDESPPPLPGEHVPEEHPPLPNESPPSSSDDRAESSISESTSRRSTPAQEPDPWQAIWEPKANAYYFYNAETHETTWLNPRVPKEEAEAYLAAHPPMLDEPPPEEIYDPEKGQYAFAARFNAKTGKWQNNPEHTAENFSTEGQIMRSTREYFDVSQMTEGKIVGKSGGALKSERRTMKIPKAQLKELIRRKREKKDRNKREWYRNDDIIVRKH